MKFLSVIMAILVLMVGMDVYAKRKGKARPGVLRGNQNINKVMKVRGQTRTLSMMLVLKNKKDSIEFINIKKNYREEILNTEY